VLQRSVPAAGARQLLFWPDDEDMALYATHLLAGVAGEMADYKNSAAANRTANPVALGDREDARGSATPCAVGDAVAVATPPHTKMQHLGLKLRYMVHSRSWIRVKPFIEAGGLRWAQRNHAHTCSADFAMMGTPRYRMSGT
jgi:hypothetical protein